MLYRKQTSFFLGPELRQGRQVQVEAPEALVEAGPSTLREGHAAVGVGVGVGVGVVAIAVAAVIVAALVAAQSLAGGEGLVTDGTLVGLTAGSSGRGRGGS